MNPDQPSREQIETRITALLLGELPADEAALLRYTIAQDPALRKLHDELQSTLVLVREAEKNPANAPVDKPAALQLSSERRQKLLAHFKTPRTKAPQEPLFWLKRIEMPRLVPVLVAVAIIALLAAMLLPVLSKSKSKSMRAMTLSAIRQKDLEAQIEAEDRLTSTKSASTAAPPPPTVSPEPPAASPPVPSTTIVLPQTQPEEAPFAAGQTTPAGSATTLGTSGIMTAEELSGHVIVPKTSQVYSQNVVGYQNLAGNANLPTGGQGGQTVSVPPTSAAANSPEPLIQDAKKFYERGEFDAAKAGLNQAIALDPNNTTATYYLNLIKQNELARNTTQHNTDTQKRLEYVEKQWILPKTAADSTSSTPSENNGDVQNARVVNTFADVGGLGGSDGGASRKNGAVVGVVNAFSGSGGFRKIDQGGGGGGGIGGASAGNGSETKTPTLANNWSDGGVQNPPEIVEGVTNGILAWDDAGVNRSHPENQPGTTTPATAEITYQFQTTPPPASASLPAGAFPGTVSGKTENPTLADRKYYRVRAHQSEEDKTKSAGEDLALGPATANTSFASEAPPMATPPPARLGAPVAAGGSFALDQSAGTSKPADQPVNTAPIVAHQNGYAFNLQNANQEEISGFRNTFGASQPQPNLSSALQSREQNSIESVTANSMHGTHVAGMTSGAATDSYDTSPSWTGLLTNAGPNSSYGPPAVNKNQFVSRYAYTAPIISTNYIVLKAGENATFNPGQSAIVPDRLPMNNTASAAPSTSETLSLNDALDRYSQLTGRTVMRSALPSGGPISLPTSLSKEDETKAIEGVLAMNGVSVVNIGDKFVKALPSDEAGMAGGDISRNPVDATPTLAPIVSTNYVAAAEQNDKEDIKKNGAYTAAQADLEQKKKMHELLYSKLEAEKLDLNLPKASMVQITDPAQPGKSQSMWQRLTGQVESTARVKVENDVTDIPGMSGTPTVAYGYDPYFIQTTFEIMQSEAVLGKVVDKLDLQSAWAKNNGGEKLNRAQAIELLKQRLDLQPVKNTKLISISAKSSDPQEAAELANGVAKAYAEYRVESRQALTTNGVAMLEDEFAKQSEEIRLAQAKVSSSAQVGTVGGDSDRSGSTNVAASSSYVTQVVQLRYVKPTDMVQVLRPFAGLANSIVPIDGNGTMILRDTPKNVERMLKMIGQMDLSMPAEYISEVIPIRYSKVDDIASAVNELGSKLVGQTKIIANENGNSLLVYANRADIEVIKGAVAKLDIPDQPLRKPAPNAPIPQPEILTSNNAFSTFSMNVSDVSFKFAEASLQNGKLPDTASIRSEEFINAFDYRDPEAAAGQPMAFNSERALYPFAQNRELLRFSLKTAAAGRQAGRPLNLVLLLDTSGSMERADRVEIIREALRVLTTQLHPDDIVSVVSFARTARLWADGVSGDKAGETLDKVGSITPEGGTNLEEAMRLAYETAHRHYLANGMNRVVLLTDGAANLGNVDPNALEQKVEAQRKQGIALDCFGIGWEDFNDDLLEQLSSNGDGRYAFLNSPEDAAKDFGTKLAGALQVAAQDLKVQVEFNPQRVIAYRQIGYAKHQLTKEQFRDNTVAAGEIAAQEAGNALYTVETNPDGDGPVATVHVRYRIPGTQDYQEHSWDVPYTGHAPALEQSSPAMRLAATASAFSEWLAASPFAQEVTPDDLLKYLSGVPEVYGADDRPKQLETMIREAKSLEGK